MRRIIQWMTVVVLCGAATGESRADPKRSLFIRIEGGPSMDVPVLSLDSLQSSFQVARSSNLLGGGSAPHTRTARFRVLYAQAVQLYEAGQYAPAIAQGEAALASAQEVLSRKDPAVASCLELLGVLHGLQGAFAQAEPLLQRALDIREEALGQDHPKVADSLNNLANLYETQGAYARAEPLYERTLAIREEALGQDHPDVATSLTNLANLYEAQGSYARAEPLLRRALRIREEALGEDHSDVAASLNNLANLYAAQGSYARAEPLHQRALALWSRALGEDHSDVAASLNNLANLYEAQGLSARAQPLYERALAIWEQTLGQGHPDVAASLNNLAQLRLAQGRLDDAVLLLTRAFSLSERRLRQEALSFSEARLTRFLQHLRLDEERLYALLRAHPEDAGVRRLALSAVLLLKGRSVEELANTSRAIYRSLGARDRETFERLRELRSQLATLSIQGPGRNSRTDDQQRLQALAAQGDVLEADLAKRSALLRARTALPAPAEIVHQVAAALPNDGALVEFIAYRDRPFLVGPGMPVSKGPLPVRYLALVLLPDADIRVLDLGPAEPIDRAASALRHALANRDAAFQPSAQRLYTLAFQPLLPLLGEARRLFLSPDGQLGLVPFAALHDGQRFLLDAYDFIYLTSGKDLLPRPQQTAPSGSVIVLADPDFSAPLPAPAVSSGGVPRVAERSTSAEHVFSALRAHGAESLWAPLPGTRQEAEAIQRLIPQAQVFLGTKATKERLLQLPTPGILHLATHGFFLEDEPVPTASRAVVHFGALGEDLPAQRLPDPLLRSGLVLSGARASTPPSSGAAAPRLDRALVTALELAGLNLWGTELVVLSACDTGRGDIQLGQGVYGLRRALVVAGAETVVMSLWKVRDDSTRQLMEAYYRNLLAGQGRATALREAMRTLRRTHPHPHDWAPFIALGRDAPLLALAPSASLVDSGLVFHASWHLPPP